MTGHKFVIAFCDHQILNSMGLRGEAYTTPMTTRRYQMKRRHDPVIKAEKANELVDNATVSIEEAIATVSAIGGTIYDVKLRKVDGRVVWRVKLVRATERVKVYVDAKLGDIIEAKAEVTAMEVEPARRISAMEL
jgi:hypothetical protein